MSRIGKLPIQIPKGVEVKINGDVVNIKGPLGQLSQKLPEGITVKLEDNKIHVNRNNDLKKTKALHGLIRALLANHVKGVSEGWTKRLQLVGVGYRANLKGNTIILSLGYSHDINYDIPEGIKVKIDQQTKIELTGIDKQKVGQVAAVIRSYRPPEPYKGKGIKYEEEVILRKAGKAGKGK